MTEKKKLTDDERKALIAKAFPGVEPENVILGPRRSELIEDGVLVDVSETAKEAGFNVPVALTRACWERHVVVPEGDRSGQDEKGRLWDVLVMAGFGFGKSVTKDRVVFELLSAANDGKKLGRTKQTSLLLVVEGDDNLEPAVTIALPDED